MFSKVTTLVRLLQKIRANRMCIHREVYFKELARVIMEAGISNIFRVVWKLDTHTRADAVFQVQMPSAGRIPSCSGEVSFLF